MTGQQAAARPVSGIRLRQPLHTPSAVADIVRPWRDGHQLIYVVSQQPNTTSSHSDVQFDAIGSRLWSPARTDPWTDLVSPVHCRPDAARQMSSSHATCVCRRHPDLWTLSAVRRWQSCSACHSLQRRDFSVDEGKSTAAESRQDRGPLARLIQCFFLLTKTKTKTLVN